MTNKFRQKNKKVDEKNVNQTRSTLDCRNSEYIILNQYEMNTMHSHFCIKSNHLSFSAKKNEKKAATTAAKQCKYLNGNVL